MDLPTNSCELTTKFSDHGKKEITSLRWKDIYVQAVAEIATQMIGLSAHKYNVSDFVLQSYSANLFRNKIYGAVQKFIKGAQSGVITYNGCDQISGI